MFREFFSWWFGQLADLLPAVLRRTAPFAEDATVIAPVGPIAHGIDAVAVGQRRNGRETPLGRFALGPTGVGALPQPAGRPIVLRLGEADVLGKTVVLPLAAERELEQVLSFEMDRETPFRTDALYWSHRIVAVDRQNGRLSVRLQLLPKANLAPLLDALGQIGIAPQRVEIADGPDAGACLPLSSENGVRRRVAGRVMVPIAAACCAALLAAVVVTPFVRQAAALASLDRQIVVGRAAARLIGAFAADQEFRNPAFAAPVTRIEALRQEIFTIVAEVGP